MPKIKRLDDRRKHMRYWVQDGAVAVPRSSSAKMGRIIDISRKGLAVRYTGEMNWLNGASQLDIMLIDDDYYYLPKLSAKIISDYECTFYVSGRMREEKRCGLEFRNLSGKQLTEIDQFIHKFTVGRVLSFHAF
jgi:c-di-GMP-binding flagellar brake protein YcgR